MTTPRTILVMEDDQGLARLCQKKLEKAGYRVEVAYDGESGLAKYHAGSFDTIVLDHVMPGQDGLQVIRQLAAMGPLPPIIMATGAGNEQLAVEAMRLGAHDYLIKDVNGGYLDLLPTVIEHAIYQQRIEDEMRLAARVFEHTSEGIFVTDAHRRIISVNTAFTTITGYPAETVLGAVPALWQSERQTTDFYQRLWNTVEAFGKWEGELWDRRCNQEEYPVWHTISTVKNERDQLLHYLGYLVDITERKRAEAHLYHLATHDTLTDLPNRALFYDRLAHAMKLADRKQQLLALYLFDLDRFKPINDTLGHAFGDQVLQQVATRLTDTLRNCDTIARLGGDEFTVLTTGFTTLTEIAGVAQRILDALAQPYLCSDHQCRLTASIGISLFPTHSTDADQLIKQADAAMYRAKERQNCYEFYQA